MSINAVIRFLQAARSMAQRGMKKEQILDFARREFGKISELLKRQIDDIYSRYKKPKTEKKGDVVPIKKKEGIQTLDESNLSDSPLGDLEKIVKGEGNVGLPKNLKRPGGALDPVTGVTRTLARKILDKKGIKIDRREDPLDVFENTIGFDVLTDVKNLADDIVEAENTGRKLKSIDELLEIEGLFNVKISDNPVKGMTNKELSENLISQVGKEFQLDVEKFAKDFRVSKEEALRISKLPAEEQQKILRKYIDEDFKQQIELSDFDVTGRKPNAEGGLIDILKI